MGSSILINNLGYPRMGALRQLKKALESYWSGTLPEAELLRTAAGLRQIHWTQQKELGVDIIPSNDFSLYDHVLDTAAMVGAVPKRFGWKGESVDLPTFFAMARGRTAGKHEEGCECHPNGGAQAMEMTKWLDTNYHYIVPEFHAGQSFKLSTTKAVDEFNEALALGIKTKPVLVGPVSFLKLGKAAEGAEFDHMTLLPELLKVYVEVLNQLAKAGAEWVQLDEPVFGMDLDAATLELITKTYSELAAQTTGLKLAVACYFSNLGSNLKTYAKLPVAAVHLDMTCTPHAELTELLAELEPTTILSLGVVQGRNVWRNDYAKSLGFLRDAVAKLGEARVWLSPSCSLLHAPVSVRFEKKLDAEVKSWLVFADEKLQELAEIRSAFEGNEKVLQTNQDLLKAQANSPQVNRPEVVARGAKVTEADLNRAHTHEERKKVQQDHLHLPELATTTIGSFPQTEAIRGARAQFRKGSMSAEEYEKFLEQQTVEVIKTQEELGLDVLVHGEYERTDMVEYFGEQLDGFAFTENGWVQSYGSRCVKPPILFGDVLRKSAMTVRWSTFAQKQTKLPMKGMLTGPITILQWSFVRNDQPRSESAKQIALAILDEVKDLEAAGISIIQVDEPALREGLPLRKVAQAEYLKWAVDAFRLATAGVQDKTQIHTHMCYCDFGDVMEAIAALDADVISIESSRSRMELLQTFRSFKYPNDVGPGVWDIHSPRVPSTDEMTDLLKRALAVLPKGQVWVNPDCGLKTRKWPEVLDSLKNMVAAAKALRS